MNQASKSIKIAPSLLSADFANLGAEISSITQAGADWIHFDIMDGHFVPNITMGPLILKALRPYSHLPFDAHLMMYHPENYIDNFIDAGANIITLHQEATPHLHRHLSHIRQKKVKAGISLNPSTSHLSILPILDNLDVILIMSVNPGFGGQKFISSQLSKIEAIANIICNENLDIEIQVDGGVHLENAEKIIGVGATCLVAGNAIFGQSSEDYRKIISQLKKIAEMLKK